MSEASLDFIDFRLRRKSIKIEVFVSQERRLGPRNRSLTKVRSLVAAFGGSVCSDRAVRGVCNDLRLDPHAAQLTKVRFAIARSGQKFLRNFRPARGLGSKLGLSG